MSRLTAPADAGFPGTRRRFLLQSAALGLVGAGFGLPLSGRAGPADAGAVSLYSLVIALGGRLVGEAVMQIDGGGTFLEAVPVSSATPAGLALRQRQFNISYNPGGMHATFNEFVASAISPREAPPASITVMANDTASERYRLTLANARPVALHYSFKRDQLQAQRWALTLAVDAGQQTTLVPPGPRQSVPLNVDPAAVTAQLFIEGIDDFNAGISGLHWSATLMPTPMDPQTGSRWAIRVSADVALERAARLTQWLDEALRIKLVERQAVLRLARSDGTIATELVMDRVGPLSAELSGTDLQASDDFAIYRMELYARAVKLKFSSATAA